MCVKYIVAKANMIIVLIVSLLLVLLVIGGGLWLVEHAPRGYEDDEGFHYGDPK